MDEYSEQDTLRLGTDYTIPAASTVTVRFAAGQTASSATFTVPIPAAATTERTITL